MLKFIILLISFTQIQLFAGNCCCCDNRSSNQQTDYTPIPTSNDRRELTTQNKTINGQTVASYQNKNSRKRKTPSDPHMIAAIKNNNTLITTEYYPNTNNS